MSDANPSGSVRDFARRERPLEGLHVLELGALIAGPFATGISERPGAGDSMRTWRYVDPRSGTSLWRALRSRNENEDVYGGLPGLSSKEIGRLSEEGIL